MTRHRNMVDRSKPDIVTSHEYPPIPVRSHDWSAYRDGHEEDGRYGWGRTEAEAIDDLINLEMEDEEEALQPCTAAAFTRGCTCSLSYTDSASIDPPEPRINPDCYLHGSAPDPDDCTQRFGD